MKRTTIMLPEDLKIQAEKAARRKHVSLGQFIRISIENAIQHVVKTSQEDPFFADKTVWKGSAPHDGALLHDKYLYDKEV
jgi:hypothetical protein